MSVWRRVRAMSREEIAFRLRGRLRTHAQRARIGILGTRWDRRAARHALHPSLLDAALRDDLSRANWMSIEQRLRTTLRRRASRYVLDAADAGAMRRRIAERFPGAAAAAASAADAILSGRYDLLGYRGLSFSRGGTVDWHADPVHGRSAPFRFWADVPYLDPASGDHKIIWELNRHQHFLQLGRALWLTGDSRYAARIAGDVASWLRANPPLLGVNWASMLELALRSLSWVAAIHFLLGDHRQAPTREEDPQGPWLLDMCIGLDRQLEHVAQNLSCYFSPNTHLTGEALALYTAGIALPELARSARWASMGRSVLLREAERQICADGGHIERSTHYHRYTLDFYTLAWLTAMRAEDHTAAAAFGRAVARLAPFMRALADANGWIPALGDDDGGMLWPIARRDPRDVRDSLAVAAVLLDRPDLAPWGLPEEAWWIAGRSALSWTGRDTAGVVPPAAVETHVFAESGVVAVNAGRHDHLVFDVGPHGFRNGGHAHADALSITLSCEGRPLLIDPGTATYTMNAALRDRMRSSRSHNTLSLDERSSAVPDGPFHWQSRADARLHHWRGNRAFAWIHASHAGYAPAACHRSIVYGDSGWLVIDEVDSASTHLAEAFWHFDPAWRPTADGPGRITATTSDGARAWLLSDAADASLVRGDTATGLGWCSPRYGSLVPTWTARCSRRLATGDAMVTWLGAGASPPAMERLRVDAAQGAVAVRIRRGDDTTVTLLRRDPEAREVDAAPAGYRTDARLLQSSSAGSRQLRLSVADARSAVPAHDGPIGIWSDHPLRDLHVSVAGHRVDLWSTEPPARLRIQGEAVAGAISVALNGREHRIVRAEPAVVVFGGDWSPAHPASGHDPLRQFANDGGWAAPDARVGDSILPTPSPVRAG